MLLQRTFRAPQVKTEIEAVKTEIEAVKSEIEAVQIQAKDKQKLTKTARVWSAGKQWCFSQRKQAGRVGVVR